MKRSLIYKKTGRVYHQFQIGVMVEPNPEWKGTDQVPSGIIKDMTHKNKQLCLRVGNDPRFFMANVFRVKDPT